jgi:hypothetical protein
MAPGGTDEIVELVKLAGGPSAVLALGWWLKTQFTNVHRAGEKRMKLHEKQDERRHRQNLVRFAKINMKLGIEDAQETNGDHDEPEGD